MHFSVVNASVATEIAKSGGVARPRDARDGLSTNCRRHRRDFPGSIYAVVYWVELNCAWAILGEAKICLRHGFGCGVNPGHNGGILSPHDADD